MSAEQFFTACLSNLVIFPAAILCLAPMRNWYRGSFFGVFWRMMLVIGIMVPIGSYLECALSLSPNLVFLPMMILFFIAYHFCLRVHISKSLSIFIYVCAIMSVFANLANALDAKVHPEGGALVLTRENALYQFTITMIGTAALFYLFYRFGSHLVDYLDINRIWYVTIILSGMILFVNVNMVPQKYETLYTNKVFRIFLLLQVLFLCLELMQAVVFYYIVEGILNAARIDARKRFLEAEERSYRKQKKYMDETARQRHDFKQTVRALNIMAQENDLEGIKTYLGKYIETMPENDVKTYCANSAVNAVLNYYAQSAVQNHVDLILKIDLPETVPISEIDLCASIGNILDNAISACCEIEEGSRYIRLSVTVQNQSNLYIVAVNSFNGKAKKIGNAYLSTHRKGYGIGLLSVASIAGSYGGTARFYDEGTEFFSDVMMQGNFQK